MGTFSLELTLKLSIVLSSILDVCIGHTASQVQGDWLASQ